jgi:peptide deformylase
MLRTKVTPVEIFDDTRKALYKKMLETMHSLKGCGIAAQQVGWTEHVFIVDLADTSRTFPDFVGSCTYDGRITSAADIMPLHIINSVVTWTSPKKVLSKGEGCLSIPGIRGDVERFAEVEILFQDTDGKKHTLKCEKFFAFCVQHERDHLEGILFIDRLNPLAKTKIQSQLDKIQCEGERQKILSLDLKNLL